MGLCVLITEEINGNFGGNIRGKMLKRKLKVVPNCEVRLGLRFVS